MVAAIALGLAGCFASKDPLIAPEDAVFPFERLDFVASNGPDEPQSLVRAGDAYRFQPDGEDERYALVRLKAVDDGFYVAEMGIPPEDEGEEMPFIYALLLPDLDARRVYAYAAVKPGSFAPTPGLEPCDSLICIADLDAYVAYGKAARAAGADPDVTYEIVTME